MNFPGLYWIHEQPTHRPTDHRLRTYWAPTQWLAESLIILERLDNRNIQYSFCRTQTQQGKQKTILHYTKSLLVFIKHIRRSQLYLFFYFLNFNALFLPRYFKVHFLRMGFFFQLIVWLLCSFRGNWPTKAVICSKGLNLL